MFKVIRSRFNFFTQNIVKDSIKRFFLSNAYKCEEIWANRLKNPAFQKVDLNNLYHELDVTFEKNQKVNVLDIDLLFNGLKDSTYKNELDDVLLKIRLCPECILLPERTTHAAIRWYLQNASTEDLLNVLSDRINYGLFPDHYLVNLAMDKYIKQNDALTAVKIAVLQMLQEDYDNPIMKVLTLHCCFNYLESPKIWKNPSEEESDSEDEEVTKVRVKYVRNPYFDDHFDIKDTNHLVGKTLWLFGQTVDKPIGISSQLVGLVLYEKYSKCAEFLEEIISKGSTLHSEAVTKAREYSLKKPKQIEEENKSEEKKVENSGAETKSIDESRNKVIELLEKIDEKNLIKKGLLLESEEVVKQVVQENENIDIEHQCQVYKQWEKDRIDHIQFEIERAERNKVQSKIKETKEQLKIEEERLFFFDKEEEIELLVEEKQEIKKSLVFYKSKGKHREKILDDYIPPDVSQRKR